MLRECISAINRKKKGGPQCTRTEYDPDYVGMAYTVMAYDANGHSADAALLGMPGQKKGGGACSPGL